MPTTEGPDGATVLDRAAGGTAADGARLVADVLLEADTGAQFAQLVAEADRVNPDCPARVVEVQFAYAMDGIDPVYGIFIDLVDLYDVGVCSILAVMEIYQRRNGTTQDSVSNVRRGIGVVKPMRPLPPEHLPAVQAVPSGHGVPVPPSRLPPADAPRHGRHRHSGRSPP